MDQRTAEDLQTALDNEEAKLELNSNNNPGVVEQYEARRRQVSLRSVALTDGVLMDMRRSRCSRGPLRRSSGKRLVWRRRSSALSTTGSQRLRSSSQALARSSPLPSIVSRPAFVSGRASLNRAYRHRLCGRGPHSRRSRLRQVGYRHPCQVPRQREAPVADCAAPVGWCTCQLALFSLPKKLTHGRRNAHSRLFSTS